MPLFNFGQWLVKQERHLIVGLGNPGRKYRKNRHNVGFMVIERLAERHNIALNRIQLQAIVGDGRVADGAVILAKPQLYMNRSGDAVGPLAKYYRISPDRTFVVYDEIDLPFGTIRVREQGGSGGHNGMKSIINHLGPDFPRLRLGIGRPPGRMEPADYVLQDFGRQELETLDAMLTEAVAATETYLQSGIEMAMTRHNGTVQAP
ncbi:MAG: aminoacyl-tRNA hydrolase [Candidatus Promineifilaceae bacterium]|nr:aminoacyl-tRNA hydrolase [Candidatus Promineifilaceae bacterium]